jgi:hypothetical protein
MESEHDGYGGEYHGDEQLDADDIVGACIAIHTTDGRTITQLFAFEWREHNWKFEFWRQREFVFQQCGEHGE